MMNQQNQPIGPRYASVEDALFSEESVITIRTYCMAVGVVQEIYALELFLSGQPELSERHVFSIFKDGRN